MNSNDSNTDNNNNKSKQNNQNNKKPAKPNKRHKTRSYAMQAIFQWHFSDESIELLMQEFIRDHLREEENVDVDFFRTLVFGTLKNCEAVDATFVPFLDRSINSLNPVELSVLRLALYELNFHPEVPPSVVINEAIELAKEFGATDGYKFVNGVLNAVVKAPKK